jgi:hypothetical protein
VGGANYLTIGVRNTRNFYVFCGIAAFVISAMAKRTAPSKI